MRRFQFFGSRTKCTVVTVCRKVGLVVLYDVVIIWKMLGIDGWKENIIIGGSISRRRLPFLHELLRVRRVKMGFSVPVHLPVVVEDRFQFYIRSNIDLIKKYSQWGLNPRPRPPLHTINDIRTTLLPTELWECEGFNETSKTLCLNWGLNPGPTAYKAGALPLSYQGKYTWWGLNPRSSANLLDIEGGRVIHCATGAQSTFSRGSAQCLFLLFNDAYI